MEENPIELQTNNFMRAGVKIKFRENFEVQY